MCFVVLCFVVLLLCLLYRFMRFEVIVAIGGFSGWPETMAVVCSSSGLF